MENLTIEEAIEKAENLIWECSYKIYRIDEDKKNFNYVLLNNLLGQIQHVKEKLDEKVLDL